MWKQNISENKFTPEIQNTKYVDELDKRQSNADGEVFLTRFTEY